MAIARRRLTHTHTKTRFRAAQHRRHQAPNFKFESESYVLSLRAPRRLEYLDTAVADLPSKCTGIQFVAVVSPMRFCIRGFVVVFAPFLTDVEKTQNGPSILITLLCWRADNAIQEGPFY